MLELEAEVARLRENAATFNSTPPVTNTEVPSPGAARPHSLAGASDSHGSEQLHPRQIPQNPGSVNGLQPTAPIASASHVVHRSLGNVQLSAAQVNEAFRYYHAQCHPYLDFSLSTSPESVYDKCPLLFWVICAVASSTTTMLELQPDIQAMVSQITVNPPRSVEVVQALLILCMWPFPFYSTLSDPSFLYCGIAMQIGLQIGLHRPSMSHEFSSRKEVLEVDDHVRRTTWIACFIVNQMQTARLGVPYSVGADYSLIQALESPGNPSSLVTLSRISRLTAQFTTSIGANGQNLSGLLEPTTRIDMVRVFRTELETLQKEHFPVMSQIIEISYLTSRLHLWSFVLQHDIPPSSDVVEFFYDAEHDAASLILLASEKNLSRCPFHIARSVLYAALTLLRILASPYAREPTVIYDQIILASRTLSSAVQVSDDHAQRWSRHIKQLVALRDRKRTPPVRARMSASIIYDAIRVMKEHINAPENQEGQQFESPEALNIPSWMNIEGGARLPDLDGLNWDDIGALL
jgi:Fungal specific transcription factor domain